MALNLYGTLLPPELICMILETLKVDDKTCQSAHAILGVALLSLWHFELFSGYCLGLVLDEETPFRYEISAH